MAELIAGGVLTLVSFLLGCMFMVLVAAGRRGGDE